MTKIKKLKAIEVLDSRGVPTVEVHIADDTNETRAIVPSGASTGIHEAVELRDGDKNRFLGKGVQTAVKNVNEIIAKQIIGKDCNDQKNIDDLMIKLDGTENKSKLGANAILAVSMACLRLSAISKNQKLFERIRDFAIEQDSNFKNYPQILPTPMMNIINGGKHADSGLDIQEFMIVPIGANSFSEALRMGSEVFHNLKKILSEKKLVTAVGDEGGFAPNLVKNSDAFDLIMQAIDKSGYNDKIKLAIDSAASSFAENKKYFFEKKNISSDELISIYKNFINKYPIISIEDGLDEDDWDDWTTMHKEIGQKIQNVGDDIFVTNKNRLQKGIEKKCANAILIKLNQIGTVTETIQTVALANKNNWNSVISHRSGETEDTIIADFAVALGTGQIKTGSLSRTDRIAKYNQLLRIEDYLGSNAKYRGDFR